MTTVCVIEVALIEVCCVGSKLSVLIKAYELKMDDVMFGEMESLIIIKILLLEHSPM